MKRRTKIRAKVSLKKGIIILFSLRSENIALNACSNISSIQYLQNSKFYASAPRSTSINLNSPLWCKQASKSVSTFLLPVQKLKGTLWCNDSTISGVGCFYQYKCSLTIVEGLEHEKGILQDHCFAYVVVALWIFFSWARRRIAFLAGNQLFYTSINLLS